MKKLVANAGLYFMFIFISIICACGIAFDTDSRVLWLLLLIVNMYNAIGSAVRAYYINRRMDKYKRAIKKITKQIEDKEL